MMGAAVYRLSDKELQTICKALSMAAYALSEKAAENRRTAELLDQYAQREVFIELANSNAADAEEFRAMLRVLVKSEPVAV